MKTRHAPVPRWASVFVVICLSITVGALCVACYAGHVNQEMANCGPDVWDCGE